MIEAIQSVLLELQGALTARALYPPSHPVIRSGENRAHELLAALLRERAEVTVFAVGERVISDNQILPASVNLTANLFGALRRHGFDRVTFERGLEQGELRALLDALAATDDARLRAGTHLRLGYIQEQQRETPAEAVAPEPRQVPLPGELGAALSGVWRSVEDGEPLQVDMLGDLVSFISKAMTDSASAMLPLASLKKHDEYTFVHTINVAMLSTSLAEAVGFSGRMAHEVAMASLLHDIGKQRIPVELLNKSGKFTDEEFRAVQEHPVDGARLLLATPRVPEIAPIVAFEHHVRADGGGYPRVPRGWRLSLASRIVQVADVFDALRTHRPYRPAMPLPQIVATMTKDAGSFFDADLLEIFFSRVAGRGVPEPESVLT